MSKVAIILVNYKNNSDTLACLNSLGHLKTKHTINIYVVNTATNADNKIVKHRTKPMMINSKDNLGFSASNNMGIKKALASHADYVILLNNDTKVDPGFLNPLVKRLENPRIAFVSPKIYFYPGQEYHKGYTKTERGRVIWYAGGIIDWKNMHASHWGVDEVDLGQHDRSYETQFATGCCLATTAATIKKIGLLDEDYFLYWEDVEWSHRASKRGYKIIYEPNSSVWHKNAGSTDGAGSRMHRYYQTRNRLMFGLKYGSIKTKLSLVKEAYGTLQASSDLKVPIMDAILGRGGKRHE